MSFALLKCMKVFFHQKQRSAKYMGFLLVVATGLLIPTGALLGDVSSHTLPLMGVQILAIGMISTLFEASLVKRWIAIFVLHLLFFLSGLFVVYIVAIVYDVLSFDKMSANIFFTSLVMLLSATFLQRFKNIRQATVKMPMFWVFVSALPVMVALVFTFALLDLPRDFVGVFFMAMLIGFFLLSFYLYDTLLGKYEEKAKATQYALESQYYLSQCQLMAEAVEKMKLYRHDVKLHLATLKDFTTGNKAASDYLDSLLGDMGANEIYSDTGHIAFDSVINFKLKTAVRDHIKVNIDAHVPPNLPIAVPDVVTIMGNLLDNALDAVGKVEDKSIHVHIQGSKGNVFIQIDNTFDGQVLYANSKAEAEKNLATRKKGENHGYGLRNVRNAVAKYNGHIDISHDDKMFCVGVLLYMQ